MNQEQNNWDQNNFNIQSNNGILNDQPLNNQNVNQSMGFNQQPINQQIQSTQIFNPEKTITSIVDNNNDNSSATAKNNKKKNIIIGVIVLIVILIISLVAILFFGRNTLVGVNERKEHAFVFIYEDSDGTQYYVDENNKLYTFSGYESLEEFENDYAVFSKRLDNGKIGYGVINKNGKEIIKSGIYSEIRTAISALNYFLVYKDGLSGVIDINGKPIIPIIYDDVTVDCFSDEDACLFIVEKDGEFHYASSNGTIFLEAEEPSYWGSSTRVLNSLNDEYDNIVEINEKYYNIVTGEEINIQLINENYFKMNILFNENGYEIYGKDAKVIETFEYPGLGEFDVYVTQTNHIVVTGRSHKNNKYSAFYRIYDMNYKFLKGEVLQEISGVTVEDVNEKYFYIVQDSIFTNSKINKMILFDSKLNETSKESLLKGHFYETNSGEIIYTESDYKKRYEVFNLNGDKLFSLDKNYGYIFKGDLFALYDLNNSGKYSVYNLKGEKLASGFADYEFSGKNFVVVSDYYYNETLVFSNGKTIYLENYKWSTCGDFPYAYNEKTGDYKIYNLEGKQILETLGETSDCISKRYHLLMGNDKATFYETKSYKPIFKFDSNKYIDYYGMGVSIIELTDGFYTVNGKLILSKE